MAGLFNSAIFNNAIFNTADDGAPAPAPELLEEVNNISISFADDFRPMTTSDARQFRRIRQLPSPRARVAALKLWARRRKEEQRRFDEIARLATRALRETGRSKPNTAELDRRARGAR